MVTSLDALGYAAAVGIERGDAILKVDGQPATEDAFQTAIDVRLPGDWLPLEVERDGERSRFSLLLDVGN